MEEVGVAGGGTMQKRRMLFLCSNPQHNKLKQPSYLWPIGKMCIRLPRRWLQNIRVF